MKHDALFRGKELDQRGQLHDIYRVTCLICGYIRTEKHYGCCGYLESGVSESPLAPKHDHPDPTVEGYSPKKISTGACSVRPSIDR